MIGELIRNKRKQQGLTQDDLAKKIGLDRSAISRIENGYNSMRANTWIKLCKELNISESIIIKGVDKWKK